MKTDIICWWSGGVTSAVAGKICIELFGLVNCRFVFIDTKNESEDTYRFKVDCETWYGKKIESITNEKYEDIREVWFKFLSLNVANGAICSSELKREMRLRFERENEFRYQTQGFDIEEPHRAVAMKLNYSKSKTIYPLLLFGYSKPDCVKILEEAGIKIPADYYLGYNNNNCGKTGCVQGGIGYWQLKRKIQPDQFDKMAEIEHDLTNLKGRPVTMLKDQSKGGGLVFLKPHPDYPHIKDISMMKGRPPKPLMDCNGVCGTNDLKKNPTELELNFDLTPSTPRGNV